MVERDVMTVAELLARARSAAGKGIKYRLGAGGMNPAAASPINLNAECDCSGYVCWCLGISRQTSHPLYQDFNGGWINTDAMCLDGDRSSGLFELTDKARLGALIVYPGGRKGMGHVGIITEVKNNVAQKALHCSAGNYRKGGDAIAETDMDIWLRPDMRFLWYCGVG